MQSIHQYITHLHAQEEPLQQFPVVGLNQSKHVHLGVVTRFELDPGIRRSDPGAQTHRTRSNDRPTEGVLARVSSCRKMILQYH
jgi:hypothetical protein